MRTRREDAALSGGSPASKRFQGPEEGCLWKAIHGREEQIRSAAAALFLPYRCDRWLRYRRARSRGSHQADVNRETNHHRTCRAGNARGLTRYGKAEAGPYEVFTFDKQDRTTVYARR